MTQQEAISLSQVAEEAVQDEYADYSIYKYLANSHRSRKRDHPRKLSSVFQRLSETDLGHYKFWKKFAPEVQPKVSKLKLYSSVLMEKLLGATFAIKFLERHEKSSIRRYKAIEQTMPAEYRPQFEEILKDEEEHEADLLKKNNAHRMIWQKKWREQSLMKSHSSF